MKQDTVRTDQDVHLSMMTHPKVFLFLKACVCKTKKELKTNKVHNTGKALHKAINVYKTNFYSVFMNLFYRNSGTL
jgi:hypothetical protein